MATVIARSSRTPTTLSTTSQKVTKREQPLCLKLVVRLLPPLLTKDEFFKQLSNFYPDNKIIGDYYVQGHLPENPYEQQTYSRAYVLFKVHDDVQEFVSLVSGKPFFEPDSEDPFTPSIEKSLINRLPGKAPVSKRSESKIENQETYKRFLAFLEGKNGATEYSFLEVLKDVRKEKRRKHKALVDVSTSDRKSIKKGKEDKGKHVEDELKASNNKNISKKEGKERVKNKNKENKSKENKSKENKSKSKDQKDDSNSPKGQLNAADNEKMKHKSEGPLSESQLSISKVRAKDSKISKKSSNSAGVTSSTDQDSSKKVETNENDQDKKISKLSSDKSQVPKSRDIKSKKALKLKEDKSKLRDVSDSNSNIQSKHTETSAHEESSTPTKSKGSKKNKSKGSAKSKGTESKSLQRESNVDSMNSESQDTSRMNGIVELQSPGSKNSLPSAEVPSESQQITDKMDSSDNKPPLNQKEVSSKSSKSSKSSRRKGSTNSKSLSKQKDPDSSSNPKIPTIEESGNKNVHESLDASMNNTQEKKSEIKGKRKRKPRSRKKSDKSDTGGQHEAKEAL